jgi:DNA-binding transcriptional regulator YiaG
MRRLLVREKKQLKPKKVTLENSPIQVRAIAEEDLPSLLKETRNSLGLSFEEMAIMLDTTERTCRRWEAGESEASGQCIAKIYKLRDSYPEVFPRADVVNNKDQEEKSKLWVKELITELNNQQQRLLRELVSAMSKSGSDTKVNTGSEFNELFNRISRLEKRLTFLEDKCGYPYNPPQYDNQYRKRR